LCHSKGPSILKQANFFQSPPMPVVAGCCDSTGRQPMRVRFATVHGPFDERSALPWGYGLRRLMIDCEKCIVQLARGYSFSGGGKTWVGCCSACCFLMFSHLFRCASLIRARCSGECGFPFLASLSRTRCSGVSVFPLKAAPIFALCSGENTLPFSASLICALCSGECGLPLRASCNRLRCASSLGDNTLCPLVLH